MDKGKRPLYSGNPERSSMDHVLPEEMLGLVGGTAKDKHQGEGSSCGEETRALLIETSSGNASRGGEPQTNGGCNKQPVDTGQRVVGESTVREEDVQEKNSQEGDDPTDDEHWKLELKNMWLEAGGSWAPEGGEDEKRCGQGSGSKRKSGLPDKEAGEEGGGGGSNRNQKKRLSSEDLPPLPNPPPDMPRLWRYHIVTILRGKEVRLVIQKRLTLSDLNLHLCRVSIPTGQIVDSEFLREEERAFLEASNEKDVRVFCYDYPEKDIGERVLKLRLLVLEKSKHKVPRRGKSGGRGGGKRPKPSLMYVLRSGWSQFARDNKLKLHDLIQIWSFRLDSDSARDELCLALIVLPCNKQERIKSQRRVT